MKWVNFLRSLITIESRRMRILSMVLVMILSVASAPTPATERDATDANAVPHLNDRGRREYRDYLKAEMHRAFVIAPGGAWAWKAGTDTPDEALEGALAECNTDAEQTCLPYALNDNVVLDEKKWPTLWGPYLTEEQAAIVPEPAAKSRMMPINSCFMFTILPRWRAGSKPFPRGSWLQRFGKLSQAPLIPHLSATTNVVVNFVLPH